MVSYSVRTRNIMHHEWVLLYKVMHHPIKYEGTLHYWSNLSTWYQTLSAGVSDKTECHVVILWCWVACQNVDEKECPPEFHLLQTQTSSLLVSSWHLLEQGRVSQRSIHVWEHHQQTFSYHCCRWWTVGAGLLLKRMLQESCPHRRQADNQEKLSEIIRINYVTVCEDELTLL